MARLVVYGRSSFCPDMARWRRWVREHPLPYVEFDIDADPDARAKVLRWTGHESTPTLVIADDDGIDPIAPPADLPGGRGPRAVDRGTLLSEPSVDQIAPFLARHGITPAGPAAADPARGEPARRRTIRARDPGGEPICVLPPDGARAREVPIDRLLDGASYAARGNGYEIRRPAGDEAWALVSRFLDEEADCCPAFDFEAFEEGSEVVVRGRYVPGA